LPTEETRSYRTWTKEEEQFLLEKARFMTYPQIAEMLQRTSPSVEARARKLGVRKFRIKSWSEDELKFLMENYRKLSDKEIAERLNKSYWQVKHRRLRLQLLHERLNRKNLTTEQPEQKLIHIVENWLKNHTYEFVKEYKPIKAHVPRVDFFVKPNIIIECKGDRNPTQTIQSLIGQLMIDGFCYPNSHFFVAIPKKEKKMLKRLEMIFDYYKMPIGILLVSNEVEIYRDNLGVFMK
jgi:hypothetical protein